MKLEISALCSFRLLTQVSSDQGTQQTRHPVTWQRGQVYPSKRCVPLPSCPKNITWWEVALIVMYHRQNPLELIMWSFIIFTFRAIKSRIYSRTYGKK